MKRILTRLAAAALGLAVAGSASAGDNNGNFMVRLQATGIITQDEVKSLRNATTGADLTALPLDASVSDEFVPTLTLTYFFTKNLAVELLCCFAQHNVKTSGVLPGEAAEMWIFPPALTLQYHFDGMGAFKPYVGVGAQYIHFFDEKLGGNSLNATSVNFSDAFGVTLQAGFDFALGNGWYLNADVKKSWLDTEVKWRNANGGAFDAVAKVDVDPLIVSAGLGYRFNLEDLFGRRSAAPLK